MVSLNLEYYRESYFISSLLEFLHDPLTLFFFNFCMLGICVSLYFVCKDIFTYSGNKEGFPFKLWICTFCMIILSFVISCVNLIITYR